MSLAEGNLLLPLHEISVTNLVFGKAWFLSLPLDPSWQWKRGPSLPEVDATIKRGHRTCVASGRAWYALHDTARGYGCELTIDIRPLTSPHGWQRWSRGLTTSSSVMAGHRTEVAEGTTHRGLFRRIELRLLRVQLTCEQTERVVRLEFVGNPPPEVMADLRAGLSQLRCH